MSIYNNADKPEYLCHPMFRVTTFLENLEMSGILIIGREMSGIMKEVRGVSGNFSMSGKWPPL
jgi:hypothetical protein